MRAQRSLPFVLDLIILAIVVVGVTRHLTADAQPRNVAAHSNAPPQMVAR